MRALVFIFMMFSMSAYARIGMGEIFFETPYGHTICDCDPYPEVPVLVGWEDTLNNLETWYFYRNHIVGIGEGYYFIFNEMTEEYSLFTDEILWNNAIARKNLKPFYTVWLTMQDSPESFYFLLFLNSFLLLPFALMIIAVVIFLSIKRVLIWDKTTWLVTLGICSLIALFFFFSLNVHSF